MIKLRFDWLVYEELVDLTALVDKSYYKQILWCAGMSNVSADLLMIGMSSKWADFQLIGGQTLDCWLS